MSAAVGQRARPSDQYASVNSGSQPVSSSRGSSVQGLSFLGKNSMQMRELPLRSQPSSFLQVIVDSAWFLQEMYI